jgi:NNP family nitrate/nitrite transporter-like MFS transporter
MAASGLALLITGIAYYFLTEDTPEGDLRKLRPRGVGGNGKESGGFREACRDRRVWVLTLLYAASFGMELTIDNFAALYYTDYFHLSLGTAGVVASSFGMMNLFARALGGMASDRANRAWGLQGRALLLGFTILGEGLTMMLFSRMRLLPLAIGCMMLTGLFVKMSNGANYAIVPFVNRRALGAVAGIVGAGGNAGAVLAGFLFRTPRLSYPQAFLILGALITVFSILPFTVWFAKQGEPSGQREIGVRLRGELAPAAETVD